MAIDLETGVEDLNLSILDKSPEPNATDEKEGINLFPQKESGIKEVEETPSQSLKEEKNITLEKKEKPSEEEKKTETSVEEKVSPIKAFAEYLGNKGIVDYDADKFEDSEEHLVGLVENRINKEIEAYKASLPDEVKTLIEYWEDGISIKDVLEARAKFEDYSNIKSEDLEDNTTLQERLVRDYLAEEGYSTEKIDKKLERYKATGSLKEEAEDALESLVELQKEKEAYAVKQAEEMKKAHFQMWQDHVNSIKTYLKNTPEIIPGFKLTDADREKLFRGITEFDKSGKTLLMKRREEDPTFDMKVAYLDLILNWDFSSFDKKAASKATKKLVDVLKSSESFGTGFGKTSAGSDEESVDFDVIRAALK